MISSVYAEVARRHGWLRPDRVLPESAYREIAQASASWCEQDRSLADLLAAFGPPSLGLGPTNPRCSKTMTYLTDSLSDPCLSFHLWNNRGPGSRDREYPEPMLLAVRRESDHFADSFTFTPLGREHASA